MSNEQFISELRSHVNGLPVQKARASRTKKFGKRGLLALGALIVAGIVVSASVLTMFGGFKQGVNAKVSIWVDGEKDGAIHDLGSVELYGGEVFTVDHTLENKGGHTITVASTQDISEMIDGTPTPCTQDEITAEAVTYTAPTGTLTYSQGSLYLTRFDNQVDARWQLDHTACYVTGGLVLVILRGDNTPWIRVTYSENGAGGDEQAHYQYWTGSAWGSNIVITIGSTTPTDPEYPVTVMSNPSNQVTIHIAYEKLPNPYYWGYKATDNVPETLTVATGWDGTETDTTHMVADGYTFTPLEFPYTMLPHQLLAFKIIYTTNPMIGENPYYIETTFTPN